MQNYSGVGRLPQFRFIQQWCRDFQVILKDRQATDELQCLRFDKILHLYSAQNEICTYLACQIPTLERCWGLAPRIVNKRDPVSGPLSFERPDELGVRF